MTWIAIGNLNDIPRRGARCVQTAMGRVAVFRTAGDRVFAIEDRCPHKGGPLSQGIVHGAAVTCPLHNWVISLETGEAQGADHGKVRTIPVRIEGERLFLSLAGSDALAAWQCNAPIPVAHTFRCLESARLAVPLPLAGRG